MSHDAIDEAITCAANAVAQADALVVTAGAGMGVDSGLPDFRGPEGFWRAYPAYRELGLRFEQMANPRHFADDPALGWGFYGHRLSLYRTTAPHAGFAILKRWVGGRPSGGFVFTSNVDGHFQKAGFDPERVVECHGSIHHLQCTRPCREAIWGDDGLEVRINERFRAEPPLPKCAHCGELARPNICMFNDWTWIAHRTEAQEQAFARWLRGLDPAARLLVVECGAGTGVPTVRQESERLLRRPGTTLIRINLREPHGPRGTIPLPLGAAEALRRIDEQVK